MYLPLMKTTNVFKIYIKTREQWFNLPLKNMNVFQVYSFCTFIFCPSFTKIILIHAYKHCN